MAQPRQHTYEVKTRWHGGADGATKSYKSYSRDHVVEADGKAPLAMSADPNFRGDAARHNPEDLLVASLSACHMLWYLHLCSINGVEVVDYVDSASGTMEETGGSDGHFTEVVLRPVVTIAPGSDRSEPNLSAVIATASLTMRSNAFSQDFSLWEAIPTVSSPLRDSSQIAQNPWVFISIGGFVFGNWLDINFSFQVIRPSEPQLASRFRRILKSDGQR